MRPVTLLSSGLRPTAQSSFAYIHEAARHQLLLTGYDRQYGARPLKRAIQRLIQDPLAVKILDGEVLSGDTVKVDADPLNNQLRFRVIDHGVAATPQTAQTSA